MRPKTVVTLSRQMGSGGTYIGYLAARKLGFRYVDREILQIAAERFGTDPGALEHLDERSSGLLANLIRTFSFSTPVNIPPAAMKVPVYDKDLFAVECRVMNEIADRHDAVIVGRAGFHALRGRSGLVRVFVHAPLEFRIRRVMAVRGLAEADAEALVTENDRLRARFIRDMVGVSWTDCRSYHLCIDASLAAFEKAVGMILDLVGTVRAAGDKGV